MFLSNSVPTCLISFRLTIRLHLSIAYTERRWTRSPRIWHAERRDRESPRRSTWQTVVSRLVTRTTGSRSALQCSDPRGETATARSSPDPRGGRSAQRRADSQELRRRARHPTRRAVSPRDTAPSHAGMKAARSTRRPQGRGSGDTRSVPGVVGNNKSVNDNGNILENWIVS